MDENEVRVTYERFRDIDENLSHAGTACAVIIERQGREPKKRIFRHSRSYAINRRDAERWVANETSRRESTPSPWHATWVYPEDAIHEDDDTYSIHGTHWKDGKGEGRQIALVIGREDDPKCASARANATLIAAAPDMLEMLIVVDELWEDMPQDIADRVEAAIRLALNGRDT